MRRLLLDQSAPKGLRHFLIGYTTRTAYEMGWHRLANGNLLTAAEHAGFLIVLSADQNIWHQVNLAGRQIALVILGSNHWVTIREGATSVVEACDNATAGSYMHVDFPPPLRRARNKLPESR